jgi:peptidyl-prolyl cis-trans isomerase D
MLLGIMRKHAKSWLIKFLIGIIAIVFIFYFGYSFTAKRGLKIAYVNGDLINGPEYEKTYRDLLDALQKQYKDMWNDNLIKMSKKLL